MSDISVLSHEYRTTSEFAQKLSQALILLKKYYLSLPGSEKITQEQLEKNCESVSEILSTLIAQMSPPMQRKVSAEDKVIVPGALVAKLRQERKGDLAYFLEDLENIALRLKDPTVSLTEGDLRILDSIASAADEQTSRVFRRLMRK